MHSNGSQPPRDVPPDGSDDMLVSTLRATIRAIITQGTRFGTELKACENMFANSETNLKQDPSNRTLIAEHKIKKTKRDACCEQVEQISIELANQLQGAVRQLLSQTQAGPSAETGHLSTLEKQITRIEEEMESKSREQREAIDQLHQRVSAQSEEIDALKQRLQQAQPFDPDKLPPGRMGPERLPSPAALASHPEADSTVNRSRSHDQHMAQDPEMDNRLTLAELANLVSDLHQNVVATLTQEIPANLQLSVRLMQEDVNKAVDSSLRMCHERLADLVREMVARLEARIEPLERKAARCCPSEEAPIDPARPAKEPTPASVAEQPPPSKDPRLRRRQSVLPSHAQPDAKPPPPAEDGGESCAQQ